MLDQSSENLLGNVSFEDLLKMRDKYGLKKFNNFLSGEKNKIKQVFHRENKNRPRETSSKLPPFRQKTPQKKQQPTDPRFHSCFGEFDQTRFEKNYKFLDNVNKKEMKLLKKCLRNPSITEEERQEISLRLQRMGNQRKERIKKKQKKDMKHEERAYEIQQLKDGRKPQYVKKSDENLLHLVRQFETLKEKGGLQRHIKRRQTKLAQKDKKKFGFINDHRR